VFRNPVNDAVQHDDSSEPTVTVRTEEDARYVRVIVTGNGPGIPSELTGNLFEKGQKGLDSEGTGIGLSGPEHRRELRRERPGQNLSAADSEAERGTNFIVELRTADGHDAGEHGWG